MKTTLMKIVWFFFAAIILTLTIRYIKVLPVILKVLALLANVVAFYIAYKVIKPNDN
ncbi:MAG: hypothetical protein ACPG21_03590 [Crocinitomicaceae bacterium]